MKIKKKFGLIIFFICCLNLAKAQDIDVLHYQYDLNLNDQNDTIQGLCTVTFVARTNQPNVSFDISDLKANGKGMIVTNIHLNPVSRIGYGRQNHINHERDKLNVSIYQFKKGDTATVHIFYKGIPDDGLIISKNKYGDRTFFADNWPNRAHHWIPCIDRPDDKASFEFFVHAPSHYDVISNGIKMGEKEEGNGMKLTHWKEDSPQPTKVMVIGVAKFATKTFEDSPPNIPISAWFYPQDSTKGFYDYAVTPAIVKFFSDYIAPFPYNKLANVQSKTIFGGMENASCIFYNEDYVTGDRRYEDVMAHEIAHQWFGDMLSEKSFAHLWLSEGFADYFENFYFEKKYGEETARKKWEAAREDVIAFAKQSTHPVVDSTSDLMSLLNANSYKKGAWVLRMLRNEVGDSIFHKIIQAYYNQYKGSNAETKDFEAVAEQVSGKDLKWFFDQWLYRPGVLRLHIKRKLTKAATELIIEQLQKDLYQFTLPVYIETGSTKGKTGHFKITERTKTISLSKDNSIKVIIDPGVSLLFEESK